MLKKLHKLDLAIILLASWTLVSLIFFKSSTFSFFLWLTVIVGVVRLLGIVRRRLLWKIRNRLIISSLFFIVTPIVLITIFFYLIINIIIYQYNTAIFDNLLQNDIKVFTESADYYLGMEDKQHLVQEVERFRRRRPRFLNLAFFKEKNGRLEAFFTYPENLSLKALDPNGPLAAFKSGFFKAGGVLYHGVQQRQGDYAVLIIETLDQETFDAMPPIGDFKVMFMGASGNTLSASSQELSLRLNDKDFSGFEKYHFPFPFTFRFWDFDELKDGKPVLKFNMFLLINDYSKIMQKLKTSDRTAMLGDQARALEAEIGRGGDPALLAYKSQQLDELRKELQVLQKRDSQSSVFPISTLVRFMLCLFGFFIVMSFIFGFRMVRVITKAVNELTKGTEKIRRGDFSYRIRLKSREQMHFLAESFNDMASGIGRLLTEEKEKERLQEELRIARGIQLKLLPADHFACPEFDIAAVNIPATEIAGDYFDYFHRPGEFLSVLVADVSGKGAQAAFYMAELKGIMNCLQKTGKEPAAILNECNISLQNSFEKVTFITINLVRFDLQKKTLIFSRSGHTPALFYKSASQTCLELSPRGMALGLNNFSQEGIEELQLPYQSGDILFFFSDGLSEIMDMEEKMLGVPGLKKMLIDYAALSALEIKERILEQAIAFASGQSNADDLTFVVMKVR
ncbi:MAG: SpoIIE family protein phosphatase [Candidatus Aminicenantes bacterium]|nr:SpoIIE family protein phosphatase [Candidatus Aminicenantes bacterium]